MLRDARIEGRSKRRCCSFRPSSTVRANHGHQSLARRRAGGRSRPRPRPSPGHPTAGYGCDPVRDERPSPRRASDTDTPRTGVLYVSRYTSDAIVHDEVLAPGLWLPAKPFSVSELVAKVRQILDAEAPEAERRTLR